MDHIENAPDTLEFHRAHPQTSFGTHVKRRKLALSQYVLTKKRIYLDQKYWIYCRDAALGRPQNPAHVELLSLLRRVVSGGGALCPVAHPVLEETFKQNDPETRMATAKVIDELSDGVAIEPLNTLTQMELQHFLHSTTRPSGALHAANELVWTWPSWVMGLLKPYSKAFDEATNLAIQKAFFDTTTCMPFSSLVESLDGAPLSDFPYDTEESQRARTDETRQHKHEFKTFEDVFLIEVAGGLDALKDQIEEATAHIVALRMGRRPTQAEIENSRGTRPNLSDVICSAFKFNKVGKALPSIRIMSGIQAAIRYRDQPYKKGDMHDHLHACIALPYCNFFLTEKNLGNLLTHPPLQYDELYQCRVLWRDDEIIAAMRTL
jgi:hypothetical protein